MEIKSMNRDLKFSGVYNIMFIVGERRRFEYTVSFKNESLNDFYENRKLAGYGGVITGMYKVGDNE